MTEYLFLYVDRDCRPGWLYRQAPTLPAAFALFHRAEPTAKALTVHLASEVWATGDPEPNPATGLADLRAAHAALADDLAAAVPLWIARLRHEPPERLQERARRCAEEVCEHGDLILYRDKHRGSSARAFNALAEGIACAALVADGGTRIFGRTFTAEPDPWIEAAR